MRVTQSIFLVLAVNGRYANYRNKADYQIGGCAKLYFEEVCHIESGHEQCSGSVRRTENDEDDSEDDQIVNWESCTASKKEEIKALAPNVVMEFDNPLSPCLPSTVTLTNFSQGCVSANSKKRVADLLAFIDSPEFEEMVSGNTQGDLNQDHFRNDNFNPRNSFGPINIQPLVTNYN